MLGFSKETVRNYLIDYHLFSGKKRASNREEILPFIEKVGCLQFDPLSPVLRNADLVLQSRFADYKPDILNELLYGKRKLFDGWDKNMSIIPIEDYPCFERKREDFRDHYRKRDHEFDQMRNEVRKYLGSHDCISSADISEKRIVHWGWAPTQIGRAVLESMYHSGELMVHHKEGTRKFYGLTESLIPQELYQGADPNTTIDDYYSWYLLRRIKAVGIIWDRASHAWLGTGMKTAERKRAFSQLLEKGLITEVPVEGIDERCYLPVSCREELEHQVEKERRASFIAPLDNMIWDRDFIEALFGFYYRWEVYTPVKKRSYGYYVQPVVYGSEFIGRIEAKFNKRQKVLSIEHWWTEPGHTSGSEQTAAVRTAIEELAVSCGARQIDMKEEIR